MRARFLLTIFLALATSTVSLAAVKCEVKDGAGANLGSFLGGPHEKNQVGAKETVNTGDLSLKFELKDETADIVNVIVEQTVDEKSTEVLYATLKTEDFPLKLFNRINLKCDHIRSRAEADDELPTFGRNRTDQR